MRDVWRKRIKFDLLVQRADKMADDEARQKISRRYHTAARRLGVTRLPQRCIRVSYKPWAESTVHGFFLVS